MIFQAVNIIRTELNATGLWSELGNIGELITGGLINGLSADVIISLINIEEDHISHNYQKADSVLLMNNHPVHLHLTLLFTATKSGSAYGLALQNIQRVIHFFQSRYVFDHSNTPEMDAGIEKLSLEMVSINFEQLNQVWSILGCPYQPSVVYKVRMVTINSATN